MTTLLKFSIQYIKKFQPTAVTGISFLVNLNLNNTLEIYENMRYFSYRNYIRCFKNSGFWLLKGMPQNIFRISKKPHAVVTEGKA